MHTTEQLNAALAGRYAIDRLVGEGGMATVYLARDVKHNRRVALKVLKPDLGAIVGIDRFLSEIEVTANLQHPNLLPLFDSGAADGLLFYVMPYVEGESLRAKLEREKQLPVEDAVRIATAVASALDYAHRHGVIHRDLKPENILMHEGQPLVADFGIALAVSNAGGNRITQTGLSLGTPQYMSPEQATGDRAIDARTDIYSLGALTYEMLTGEPPHTGSTSQAVIARVLTEKPRSIRSSRPNVTAQVEGAIERALEKLPADRWATAKDFSDALSGARPVTMPATSPSLTSAESNVYLAGRRPRVRELTAWVVAVGGIAASTYLAMRREPPAVLARLVATLPESVTIGNLGGGGPNLAISRDGRRLVVAGTRAGHADLYLRGLDEPVLQLVRGTDEAQAPTFSPDGQSLVFRVGSAIMKVSISGGTPQTLTDSLTSGPSWGDRGEVAYERNGSIWTVSSDGANRRLVAKPDSTRQFLRYYLPEILPGGQAALITIFRGSRTSDSARLGVLSLDDGTVTDLGMPGGSAHYASGRLIFARSGGLEFTAPFSLRKRALTGPAVLILEDVAETGTLRADAAVSENGTLVYRSGAAGFKRGLFAVDRQGVERQLSRDPASFGTPRVSPDGHHIVVGIGKNSRGNGDLWVHDMATSTLTRLTSDGETNNGEWTSDGLRIASLNVASETMQVVARPWDASGPASVHGQLPGRSSQWAEVSLGPAHGLSAFRAGPNLGAGDIWLAPTDSFLAARPFLASRFPEFNPRVSPSGRLLAFASVESGRVEVYLTPIPGPGPHLQVSIGGGVEPVWSHDGSTLFYRGPTRLMAATIAGGATPSVARRDSLFIDRFDRQLGRIAYDVFPDGRTFVMTRAIGQQASDLSRLFVVVNWQQLIGKQSGTGEPR